MNKPIFGTSLLAVLSLAIFIGLLSLSPARAQGPIVKGEQIDLQRAITIALAHHPTIAASANTVRVNESRIGQARSNYFPQVNWQTSYSKSSPFASCANPIRFGRLR